MLRLNAGLQRGSRDRAVPRGNEGKYRLFIRLKYSLILMGLVVLSIWGFSDSGSAGAAEPALPEVWGWSLTEVPVYKGTGDQETPDVEGRTVVYNDLNRSRSGWGVGKDVLGGEAQAIGGEVGSVGPKIEGEAVGWEDGARQVLRRPGRGVDER